MRLADGGDWLELSEATFPDRPARGTQADEDVLLNVAVNVGGFAAADQAWVTGSDWEAFVQAFRRLESQRSGDAVLLGASPDELTLRFYVYDRAGHAAVAGQIARPHYRSDGLQRLCLSFSLPFDPGLLRGVLDELLTYRGRM